MNNLRRSDSARVAKAGGGYPVVYRSEDYGALASGSTLDITFDAELSSILIHNRNPYGSGSLFVLFPSSPTPTTPVTVDAGNNLTIQKAWVDTLTLYSDTADPIWQLIGTL